MASFHHGVRVIEENEGTRPITTISTAIIGIVATSSDADDAYFPVGEPILETNIYHAMDKAGTDGTLFLSLSAISEQCQPTLVIVRIKEGIDEAATYASVLTALNTLETAASKIGVIPRIIIAPGLDADETVATALAATAKTVNGFAYARAGGNDISEAISYRENFAQRELMLLWPDPMARNSKDGLMVEFPVAAYAAGKRAETDTLYGWHHSMSNLALNGVAALTHNVSWSLTSDNSDAALLNQNEITTITSKGGYRFWGLRTCSSDPIFAFETVARTAQVLKETIAEGLEWAVGKPMNVQLVRDVIASINATIREMKAEGRLIDGKAWYEVERNDNTSIKGGRLVIVYDYTPVPPLEDLSLVQKITDRYLSDYSLILAN